MGLGSPPFRWQLLPYVRWEIFDTFHPELLHHFLLLGWPRFARAQTLVQNWRRLRRDRLPLVDVLPKKITLVREKNFCSFNLPQVEQDRWHFFRRSTYLIAVDELHQEVAKHLRFVDDPIENFFLLGLKREAGDFVGPLLEIFEFGPGGVARDFDTPVTYRTGERLTSLDLAPRDLQAFAVVPKSCQHTVTTCQYAQCSTRTSTHSRRTSPGRPHIRSSYPLQVDDKCRRPTFHPGRGHACPNRLQG